MSDQKPIYDNNNFFHFCSNEVRKGLQFRFWITLPWRYRQELRFRKEFEATLDKYIENGGKIESLNRHEGSNV